VTRIPANQVVTFTIDAATNRLQTQTGTSIAAVYDAAGNMVSSPGGGMGFAWDALGSMSHAFGTGEQFVYTADEERLGILESAGETWRLRDLNGSVLREFVQAPGSTAGCTEPLDLSGTLLSGTYRARQTLSWASGQVGIFQEVRLVSGGSIALGSYGSTFSVPVNAKLVAAIGPSGIEPGALLETRHYVHWLGYLFASESSTDGRAYAIPNWLANPPPGVQRRCDGDRQPCALRLW
jgi:hypothetical protein